MNSYKALSEAFEIFSRHSEEYPAAEHDVIYGPYNNGLALTEDEEERLIELGWFICEDEGSWKRFV